MTRWLLIIGSNSDIGIACARFFASKGFNVFLASRNIELCRKISSDIAIRYSVQTDYGHIDLEDTNSHSVFISNLQFSPDVTLISAGLMYSQLEAENNFQIAKKMIYANYLGVLSFSELIVKTLIKHNKGTLIYIGSVAGDRGKKSNYIYGSTKSAIETYTQGLEHRLNHTNIEIILVKPGFVDTKMTIDLNLPKILTAMPGEVAVEIYSAFINKKKIVYIRPIWRYIMLIIKLIPKFIFNKTSL